MGQLIAIEGIDGAGKSTLSRALTEVWRDAGAKVASIKFPRYNQSVYADLIRETLYREHGDLGASVYGMGLLYALDRRDGAAELRALAAEHDVVLIDRYVASNAAFQAARSRQGADGVVVEWVYSLEIERFGIPIPDAQVLVWTPPELAFARMDSRANTDQTRSRDFYETDDDLQVRCGQVYHELADMNWLSPWHVVDNTANPDPTALAKKLLLGG